MAAFMSRYSSQTYALMRIVIGFLFLWHGSQKLLGYPPMPEMPPEAIPPEPMLSLILYVAGPIELIGGALVFLGLFTRLAAFLSSGLMAVAYWMAHGTKAFLPVVNQGEMAVLYCFVFLFISAYGAGIWSVDGARGGAKS